MNSRSKILLALALIAGPALVRAEDTTRSNNAPMSSLERIKNRRDMHQNQLDKINAYLKERETIPSNGRIEADDKFLSTLRGGPKDHKKRSRGKDERKQKMGNEDVNPYGN